MSVKKFLMISACASVMSMTAMAGGPDRLAMPASSMGNAIYLDGHLGYAFSDWASFNANGLIGPAGGANYTPTSNENGGFSGGLDLGYSITKNIALETGWFYLPKVDAQGSGQIYPSGGSTNIPSTETTDVKSWMLYFAAKLSLAIVDQLDVFGKLGVGYRRMSYDSVDPQLTQYNLADDGHYWTPIFAAGLEYSMDAWLLGVQYLYVPNDSDGNNAVTGYGAPNAAPEVNLVTGFVGYKFML